MSMFDPTNLVPAANPAGARISIVLIGGHLQLNTTERVEGWVCGRA